MISVHKLPLYQTVFEIIDAVGEDGIKYELSMSGEPVPWDKDDWLGYVFDQMYDKLGRVITAEERLNVARIVRSIV